jgi:hypothetical protein
MDNPVIPEAKEHVQKSPRFRWLLAGFLALMIAAAVSGYVLYSLRTSCEVNAVKQASTFLTTQLNLYDRVYQVATTASRTTPDHTVNTLKQIVMDTAKGELIHYMGTVILAFEAYRAGEADAAVLDLIRRSEAQYANFKGEFKAVDECAPL